MGDSTASWPAGGNVQQVGRKQCLREGNEGAKSWSRWEATQLLRGGAKIWGQRAAALPPFSVLLRQDAHFWKKFPLFTQWAGLKQSFVMVRKYSPSA